jgi:hypothetical protein
VVRGYLAVGAEMPAVRCPFPSVAGEGGKRSRSYWMTKFKGLAHLGLGYSDGSSESGCSRKRTAGPSAALGMTKFKGLADLGLGYSDGEL